MSVDVIKSYLVELGFEVKNPQLRIFQRGMKEAAETVASATGGMVGNLLKFQIGATSAFAAAGLGVLGYIDKLASSDQQMRLFAMRSFMTLGQARSVKMALDVLGASLDDVAWDRELHDRFEILIEDQKRLGKMLGPGYEQQMRDVRDITFQLDRLQLKAEYFGMLFVSDVLSKLGLGGGTLLEQLQKLNDYVEGRMPSWANTLSGEVIPVFRELWTIAQGLGHVGYEAADAFQMFVGILSGDTSLETTKVSFESLARAISHVISGLSTTLNMMIAIESHGGSSIQAGLLALQGAKAWLNADDAAASKYFSKASDLWWADAPKGEGFQAWMNSTMGNAGISGAERQFDALSGSTDMASRARAMAKQVGMATGINPAIIWSQWAHETGGFTNRGATDLNNLAGIRVPGTQTYQSFNTLQDFASYYTRQLQGSRYSSVLGATDIDTFAAGLKKGGWFEDSLSNYEAGMQRWDAQYHIGSMPVTVNVGGTSATPAAISAAVSDGVKKALRESRQDLNRQTQTNLSGVYR